MAKVYVFPKKEQHQLIELYDDEEVFVTIACINVYGSSLQGLATTLNLENFDPSFVVWCLKQGLENELFSHQAKQLFRQILDRFIS